MADGTTPATQADDLDLSDQASSYLLGTIIGSTGYDSIHHAACMLEYLTEIESEYTGESRPRCDEGENLVYGRWLVSATIGNLLRTGLAQLTDKHEKQAAQALAAEVQP